MIITFLDLQILARKLFVIFFAISTQCTTVQSMQHARCKSVTVHLLSFCLTFVTTIVYCLGPQVVEIGTEIRTEEAIYTVGVETMVEQPRI